VGDECVAGCGVQGVRLFRSLKRSDQDNVINGLPRVKRLLKIRRTDNEAPAAAAAAAAQLQARQQQQQQQQCV